MIQLGLGKAAGTHAKRQLRLLVLQTELLSSLAQTVMVVGIRVVFLYEQDAQLLLNGVVVWHVVYFFEKLSPR